MGKTYRKMSTDKSKKKKQRSKRNQFNIRQKIQMELEAYENQKEMPELPDEYLQTDG